MAQLLIISDSHNLRSSLAGVLQHADHAVQAAPFEETFPLLGTNAVDLLIFDLRTPCEIGLKHLLAIHSLHNKLPVIVLSSTAYPQMQQRALMHGATAFLLKPVDPRTIIHCVEQTLEQQTIYNQNIVPLPPAAPQNDLSSPS